MKNAHRSILLALQVTASAVLGWGACAGSNPDLAAAPTQSTTSAAVPTENGTYDRSRDPNASNLSGGTTEMKAPAPKNPAPVGTDGPAPAPMPPSR
jgi:hypothetical protein